MSETEFLEQIRINQGIIYKLVGFYATGGEEKKDLYQEVLLQVWKAWPAFRAEAKFSTWLYRICLNTIMTHKRKPTAIEYRESLDEVGPTIPHPGDADAGAANLHWAIKQLAETDRAIISMHLDGYLNAEIASFIGISHNNVAVKLYRIRQQLSNLLTSL